MRERDIRFDTLKQLVSHLAEAVGPACEVLLHDLRNPESSCIAISGSVTGRKVGAPMTDLGLRIMKKGDNVSNLINYLSTSNNGKSLRSSTFVIRNSKRKPLAFVCINFDLSNLVIMRDVIDSCFPADFPRGEIALERTIETFPKDVQGVLKLTVTKVLKKYDKPISIMKKQDKIDIVKELDEAGIFGIKNSHNYVASILKTSRYTIYNYLNEARHCPKMT